MHCEAFEEYVQDMLDRRGELESDPIVLSHTSGCPACRQMVACYNRILTAVTQLPSGFVMTRPIDTTLFDRRPKHHWIWAMAATAALLLVGTFLTINGRFTNLAETSTEGNLANPLGMSTPTRTPEGPLLTADMDSQSTQLPHELAALPLELKGPIQRAIRRMLARTAPGEGVEADSAEWSEPVRRSVWTVVDVATSGVVARVLL
jgi:hypothetical protein